MTPFAPSPARPCLQAGARVLVTGGAGFIGSHLVGELLALDHQVHVVDDLSSGSLANLSALLDDGRLEVTIASVADPSVCARACASASMVFHLAGAVGVQHLAARPLDCVQRNLQANQALLQAAADFARPVLLTSSSEVYGDGPVPFVETASVRPGPTQGARGGYAAAKALGEWLAFGHAAQSGLPVIITRLFNTVGPRQSAEGGMVLPRFVAQAVADGAITVYGDGSQTRCFAHVRDVAAALLALAYAPGAGGQVFNVGSDHEVSVLELAQLVRAAAGAGRIVTQPWQQLFPAGFADLPRRVPSLAALRAAIGWVPATPIEAIVSELVRLAAPTMQPV